MILFLILTLLLVWSLSSKKSKPVAFVILAIAWLLFAFNYDNPDYSNYVIRFDAVSSWYGIAEQGVTDAGFSLIMHWFYVLGIDDYFQFKLIISAISLLCYFYFAKRSLVYPAFWAFLYLAFYTTLDITQLRNFIAFSFILALFPLLEKDTFKADIAFLIGVLFVSTIHFSMLFFLVMGLKLIKKKELKIALAIIVLLALYVVGGRLTGALQSSMYYDKVDAYARTSSLGAMVTTSLFVVNYLIVHFIYEKSKMGLQAANKTISTELTLANNLALYLLLLIPFVFINSLPIRILRLSTLIELGYLLNYASAINGRKRNYMLALCFLIALFYFVWMSGGALDGLRYNYLLEYFI
jgi:hypothetical protein